MVNIASVLVFSQATSNSLLSTLNPTVFSTFGLVCIQLWGLVYWAVAKNWQQLQALLAMFALEKLVYVVSWLQWLCHSGHDLPALLSASPLTGIFYLIHGPTDFAFGCLFVLAALQARRPH